MKGLIAFIAVCTLTAAMVPMDRQETIESAPTNASTIQFCAHSTPCAWAVYKPTNKLIIETFIKNTYCTCENGTVCQSVEDDVTTHIYIYKCREPGATEITEHPQYLQP